MGGCKNYDPFLGTLNSRCRIIIGIQKRTRIIGSMRLRDGSAEAKPETLRLADGFAPR